MVTSTYPVRYFSAISLTDPLMKEEVDARILTMVEELWRKKKRELKDYICFSYM